MKKTILLKAALVCAIALLCGISADAKKKAPGNLIDPAGFETEIDGKPVGLYTITNGKITAQITNYCGYVVGLYTPDRNGNYDNVVGHNETIEQYKGFSRNPCGATLGRYANRIGNASFKIDGIEYNVTKNSGKHILHGGSHGFDHTIWTVEKVTSKKVVMSCVLEDGLDGFPGTLNTTVTFEIKQNGLAISYKATTDKATVCNMSHHVYFNLDGFHDGDVLNHELMVNAGSITETDSELIPTGVLLPVAGTVFDFNKPVRIGERQFPMPAMARPAPGQPRPAMPEVPEGMVRSYDSNFCLRHSREGKVENVASLYSPESGRFMTVANNHPGLQIYTGNRSAIAMESQMYPDSPNHPEFPSTILRPGKKYKHTVIYKFSVK